MKMRARLVRALPVGLLAGWLLAAAGAGTAAHATAVQDDVLKVADALEQNNQTAAQTEAKAVAQKAQLEDVMNLMRLRSKKGLGLGSAPGSIKPDGIEAMVIELSKRTPKPDRLQSESKELSRAAYIVAAIATIAQEKAPQQKQGAKDPAKWQSWSQEMQTQALDLAAAAKSGNPESVHAAARKLNTTCNSCHGMFRD